MALNFNQSAVYRNFAQVIPHFFAIRIARSFLWSLLCFLETHHCLFALTKSTKERGSGKIGISELVFCSRFPSNENCSRFVPGRQNYAKLSHAPKVSPYFQSQKNPIHEGDRTKHQAVTTRKFISGFLHLSQ